MGLAMGFVQTTIYIASEILPSDTRGVGNGLLNVISGLITFGGTAAVPAVKHHFGIGYTFLGCSTSCFLLIVFTHLFVPETFGKSLEDIEEHYRVICYGDKHGTTVPKK